MRKQKFTPRCAFEYGEERDKDLLNAYRQLCEQTDNIEPKLLYEMVVVMPAHRFYVSEERAARVVSSMYRRPLPPNMHAARRRMFEEIKTRVELLRERFPDWPLSRLVLSVVNQPAPEFYITPNTARNVICSTRRKVRAAKRQKLQLWRLLWAR